MIGILGLRRDDGHLFPADGDLGQQPGIGLRKTLQVIGVVHRQRTPDKALLVDDLRVAEFFFHTDDIVDRVELVLQFDLFATQVFRPGILLGDLFCQNLHLDTHLVQALPQAGDFVLLPGKLFIQVCDHLLQPVDTQVRLAQLGCSTLQRGDLVLVLLQQAVDRRDIVVDLLDGTAAALATTRHRNQVFTGLYQHQVFGDGVDVLENGIYKRILGTDDRNERIPLVFHPDDRPFAHAGCEGERRAQRHGCNVLHNFLRFKLLFASREANINIKTIPCSKIFTTRGKSALSAT